MRPLVGLSRRFLLPATQAAAIPVGMPIFPMIGHLGGREGWITGNWRRSAPYLHQSSLESIGHRILVPNPERRNEAASAVKPRNYFRLIMT
jgi:hypothetical protein